MRGIIGLAAVLSLVGGLIGAFAVSQLSDPAGAAPPPPQAREDQITVFSAGERETGSGPGLDYGPLTSNAPFLVAVDAADYPSSAVFLFEVVIEASNDSSHTHCFRLFDKTANAAVAGSELCFTRPGTTTQQVRLRSASFSLASGEREYTVQAKSDETCCSNWFVFSARIIAEWTERAR